MDFTRTEFPILADSKGKWAGLSTQVELLKHLTFRNGDGVLARKQQMLTKPKRNADFRL